MKDDNVSANGNRIDINQIDDNNISNNSDNINRHNKKNIFLLKLTGFFLVATILLQGLCRYTSWFGTWYARTIYPALVGTIGRFFGIFPFSVVEIMLYLLIISIIVCVVREIRHPVWLIIKGLFVVSLLLFLYTANCGVNYYATPFSAYAGLEITPHSQEELIALCEDLLEKVNETLEDSSAEDSYKKNASAWRQEGVTAMKQLGETYPCLEGYYPRPKEVTVSYILSVQQLSGVYAPFTIEANFNGDMPNYNIPHTICHELSHLRGFMREDEANFIGYLACIGSENAAFRYSGYLMGWVYAGNALAKVNPAKYWELRRQLNSQAEMDLQANNAFWDNYEGQVAEVSNQMNDTYLKINSQSDGVQSYGRMVDLMLAYGRK